MLLSVIRVDRHPIASVNSSNITFVRYSAILIRLASLLDAQLITNCPSGLSCARLKQVRNMVSSLVMGVRCLEGVAMLSSLWLTVGQLVRGCVTMGNTNNHNYLVRLTSKCVNNNISPVVTLPYTQHPLLLPCCFSSSYLVVHGVRRLT